MNDLLANLLRLGELRPGDAGVELGLSTPLPAWGWALVALAALGVAAWSYRRLDGPLWARTLLSLTRAAILALLVLLACGPRLQRPNETVERDRVVMLVDRSGSMRVRDVDASAAGRISRDEQLGRLLAGARADLERLSGARGVDWLGFDAGVFDLMSPSGGGAAGATEGASALPALRSADGLRSDLHRAIEQGLARAGARPVAGVVLFSDGRATDEASRATLRKLAAQKVPVMVVPLGSERPLADVSVSRVEGPGVAFAGDVTPVEAEIERRGAGGMGGTGGTGGTTRVELVDTATGRVLQEQTIDWSASADPARPDAGGSGGAGERDAQRRRLTFTATPPAAESDGGGDGGTSVAAWAVRVVQDGPDLVSENDQLPVRIEIVSRPLRVVYFDGYPRWEYRFLQAILTREKSMASSALLLAAGRRSIQEGNTPLDAVPLSQSGWDAIDVIVLGDVQPDVLSPEQMRQIRQRVSSGGAGLLWIGGESATPAAWRGTPLGDLLPIQSSGGESEPLRVWERDVVVRPTPLADRLGVLRLLREPTTAEGVNGVSSPWWPRALSDPSLGWPRLRWAQRIDAELLKPAAEVLAVAEPVARDGEDQASLGGAAALVTTMRFGAGRVVYVASDEIWRWRFGRGEDYPERFWLQLIRLLGRESAGRAGRSMLLSASPARAEVGQPVRVRAELLDQGLIDGAGSTLAVRITRVGELRGAGEAQAEQAENADAGAGPAAVDLTLRGGAAGARRGEGGAGGSVVQGEKPAFVGAWVPAERGTYRIDAVDPLLPEGARASVEVEVFLADDELRQPASDHAALAELARETGGQVLAAADLARLDQLLPRRDLRIALAPDEHPLWDTPLALIALLTLLTAEWVGRRLTRLV
jgi:hypothetical protein